MTDNPFGGDGGFDMNALLEQAQAMQEQLVQAQEELAHTLVEGSAGSGMVSVKVNGTGELTDVQIRPGVFDGSDSESLGDLADLVVAAYRDAKGRADAMMTEKLGPMAGGSGGPDLGDLGLGGGQPGQPGQQPGQQGGQLGFGGPQGSGGPLV